MYLKFVFAILMFFMILVSFLRILFSKKYLKKIVPYKEKRINEEKYTIIQPILSGDPRLGSDLSENLKNLKKMRFVWLIDKNDEEAKKIAVEIIENEDYKYRIEIIEIEEVPQEINPKVFKIDKAIRKIKTEYVIILDDDSVIDIKGINELSLYENIKGEWLATGIPYNYGEGGFWSKLVSAFVNSNSIITYFTMSYLEKSKTINGMFYIARTELFKKYNVFQEIKYWLCDDFAIAQYMINKGVVLVQTGIFCNTRTTVTSFKQYILLMKRWMLFTKIYIKNAITLKFFVFILVPSVLPAILLIISFVKGGNYIFLTLAILSLKAFMLYKLRFSILGKKEEKMVIVREIINDFIVFFIFIYTVITPPVIKWRNKKIKVIDGKIRYE